MFFNTLTYVNMFICKGFYFNKKVKMRYFCYNNSDFCDRIIIY